MFTTDKSVADYVIKRIPELIKELPELPRTSAEAAWRDYGEVILCDSNEEMAKVSDQYASEHLEVLAENLDLLSTEDSATIYNNVYLTDSRGTLRADRAIYDFTTRFYKIKMDSANKRV